MLFLILTRSHFHEFFENAVEIAYTCKTANSADLGYAFLFEKQMLTSGIDLELIYEFFEILSKAFVKKCGEVMVFISH